MRATSKLLSDALPQVLPTSEHIDPKQLPFRFSQTGFVLLDRSLRPISFNAAATQILTFSDRPRNVVKPGLLAAKKIRAMVLSDRPSTDVRFVAEFTSGRRKYVCRSFAVDRQPADSANAFIALLLERNSSRHIALSRITEQFNLTARERQVVELLVEGMTTKEVANRLRISPNTVKAFLRLIMLKMGVSTRSGIIGEIVRPKWSG
jgi:DNA-binding CsgD family transcriptional regulator